MQCDFSSIYIAMMLFVVIMQVRVSVALLSIECTRLKHQAFRHFDADAETTLTTGTTKNRNLGSYSKSKVILHAKKKNVGVSLNKKAVDTSFIVVEDIHSDLWRVESVLSIIRDGGVGVIPTDTCYSFVTSLSSREGFDRLG